LRAMWQWVTKRWANVRHRWRAQRTKWKNWHKAAALHEKTSLWLAICSVGVTAVSMVVGVMAVVLTWQTLRMAERQEAISVRQAEIAERQFHILQKQVALDARLMVVGEAAASGSGVTWSIKNRGLGHKAFRFAIVRSDYAQMLGLSCRGIGEASVTVRSDGPTMTLSFVRVTDIAGETSLPVAHCDATTPGDRVGHHGFPFTWQISAADEEWFRSVESHGFWIAIPAKK